jgi:hypothetical protein
MQTPKMWQELKKLQFENANKKGNRADDSQDDSENKSKSISDKDNEYADFEQDM